MVKIYLSLFSALAAVYPLKKEDGTVFRHNEILPN